MNQTLESAEANTQAPQRFCKRPLPWTLVDRYRVLCENG